MSDLEARIAEVLGEHPEHHVGMLYGLIWEAQAEAWDKGYMRGHSSRSQGIPYTEGKKTNPYRADNLGKP